MKYVLLTIDHGEVPIREEQYQKHGAFEEHVNRLNTGIQHEDKQIDEVLTEVDQRITSLERRRSNLDKSGYIPSTDQQEISRIDNRLE